MIERLLNAAAHGRSVAHKAREALRLVLNQRLRKPEKLGTAINALFKPFGGFDLPDVPREPMREPPGFED